MAKHGRNQHRGGTLQRSESVTIRLDPAMRYLTDLAARLHRRTTSSFIEWALAQTLERIVVPGTATGTSLWEERNTLWDVEAADRFVTLAMRYPHLLTYDEQVRWKQIREDRSLWDRDHVAVDRRRVRAWWQTHLLQPDPDASNVASD
jgi:hypothetical protein